MEYNSVFFAYIRLQHAANFRTKRCFGPKKNEAFLFLYELPFAHFAAAYVHQYAALLKILPITADGFLFNTYLFGHPFRT